MMDVKAKSAAAQPFSGRSAPLLDDQPAAVDLLNFDQYATALSEVVVSPQTKTPFIIGVFGRWGTGKSTLMRMLEAHLQRKQVTSVWFNAWLYNKEEEIWAAFLQSLTSRAAQTLKLRDKLKFATRVYRRGLDASRLWVKLPEVIVRALLVATPVVTATWLASRTGQQFDSLVLTWTGAAGTAIAAGWLLIKPAIKAVRDEVRPNFSLYKSIDYEKHIGFLDQFRDQFARIVTSLPGGSGRLAIFVDDLDRCSPDQALALLDAIKVFLDVPGCIFVIGVDVAVIQRALAHKYADDPVSQQEYMSKIIQLPFHLPPLAAVDFENYLRRLDVQFPDERCREVFLACIARNPRELKRLINAFALNWYLAQARELRQSIRPVCLAKVIVIQQSFPRLFAVLRDQPKLLGAFESALRGASSSQSFGSQTIVGAEGGIAVPPALQPFASDASLVQLLTMHTVVQNDDANFAALTEDEIAAYFTLAIRTRKQAAAPPPPPFQPPPPPSPMQKAAEPLPQIFPETRTPAAPAPSPALNMSSSRGDFPNFGPNYVVLERLAIGGAGEVYLAENRRSSRKVAIKRLHSTLVDDPNWSARFEREVSVLASLGVHPNIAALLDSGEGVDADGHRSVFYVMEYVTGETLEAALHRRGRLPIFEVERIVGQIFDALIHMHGAGIVHRDLKPSTIMITADGVAKIVDFGLALVPQEGRDRLTSTGTVVGTPAYMSPEQAKGLPFDPRSDLFSMGVVMYEALTGTNPMRADSAMNTLVKIIKETPPPPSSSVKEISGALDAVVMKLLAIDPALRFQNAKEVRDALNAMTRAS